MPTPSLSEQQWEKILRLVNSPSYYVVDYVPHVPVGESFLSLDYYVEREYLPRALDRYALICLVALYTWADYVAGDSKRVVSEVQERRRREHARR